MSGQNAPPLQTLMIQLPRGLRFIRHRVHRRLKLEGVSVTNSKLESLALRRGNLVITLRHPTTSSSLTVHANGLKESFGLKHKSQPSSDQEADADRGRHRRHGQDHRVEAADQEPASMTAKAP